MSIIWEPDAKEEVREIYAQLFDYSPALADDWSDELENKVAVLTTFPEMGRLVPELQIRFIREIFVRRFRLVYQYQDSTIRILAIRPMGRPLGKI